MTFERRHRELMEEFVEEKAADHALQLDDVSRLLNKKEARVGQLERQLKRYREQ